jgi:calcium-dependent protein kinase
VSILRDLNHPNIVKLYGVFRDDEMMYLSMELCEGGCLLDRISQGPLNEAEVKGIAKQVLSALSYIHRNRIGHRDLKAENILFSREGKLKLADFGLARIMDKISDYSRVGTPYYLAPEVIHGTFN